MQAYQSSSVSCPQDVLMAFLSDRERPSALAAVRSLLAELLRTSRRLDFSRGNEKEKDGIALIKTARNFGCAFSIIQ